MLQVHVNVKCTCTCRWICTACTHIYAPLCTCVHACIHTGTKQDMNKLMKDYLQGKSSLFGLILPTDTTTPPTETTTLPPPPTEATTLPPPPTETTTLPPPPTETTTLPPPPTLASTELPPKKKKQKICGKIMYMYMYIR